MSAGRLLSTRKLRSRSAACPAERSSVAEPPPLGPPTSLMGSVSVALTIERFQQLRVVGRPSPTSSRGANLDFDDTTTLVTVGVHVAVSIAQAQPRHRA